MMGSRSAKIEKGIVKIKMRALIGMGLIVASNALMANDPVTRVSNDPENGYTVLDFDGRTFVLDALTGTITVSNGYGQQFDVSLFVAAHEYADGNAAIRNAAIADLTNFATNNGLVFTQTGSTTPRLAYTPPPIGGPGVFDPQSGDMTFEVMSPGGGLGGPCDLSPCTPYMRGVDGRIFYMQDGFSSTEGNGTVNEQEEFIRGFEEWKAAQQKQACDDAHLAAAAAGGAALTLAAVCPFSMTPPGAAGCAGAAVSYLVTMSMLARKSKECAAGHGGN